MPDADLLSPKPPESPLAIVGIGCRFPGGADDPDAFWALLRGGVDAVSEVPPDRWSLDRSYHPDPGTPGKLYTRWGGFVEGPERFDAGFFGISPREAARMDPQHRMLLEVAYEAVEDAGETLDRLARSRTGVFVGLSTYDYGALTTRPEEARRMDGYTNLGGALSISAARIAYAFDLRGPCLAVDTACSSSLVALHLACRSLAEGESEAALVGGVNLMVHESQTIGFCRASMLSPDGRCKPFDARANGYVRAEGAGVVLLMPLDRALARGLRVRALVGGTAVNQDGRSQGITVPNRAQQEALLREACLRAGVEPSAVGYVEAHGTGTPVGDPAEAEALGRVVGVGRPPDRPCPIGSVKGNIGHLEAGAGIAGVIKTALALENREIPGTVHFRTPNRAIPFGELGLRVVADLEPWPEPERGPRIAGVNSFGFGGTNAHALLLEPPRVLREPPRVLRDQPERNGAGGASAERPSLIAISARSEGALRDLAERYRAVLAEGAGAGASSLRGIARGAALHRTHHEWRVALSAESGADAAEQLGAFLRGEGRRTLATGRFRAGAPPPIVFVFSGMGQQWWAMGRELLEEEPVFREVVERCDGLFGPLAGWSLLEEFTRDESDSRIDETRIAQPAIFSLQVGLAALWKSWGIRPDVVVGHSVGEVAAAHVAGALDLEGAVTLAFHRSRLQHTTEGNGGMLAAGVSRHEAEELLSRNGADVSIAAMNAPASVTLVGEANALSAVDEELRAMGRFSRFLRVRVPYHSAWMDPIRQELLDSLAELRPRRTSVPLYSTVTGGRVDGDELGAAYWWRNVREPVAFADAMDAILDEGPAVFLELAAHPVLSASMGECIAAKGAEAERFFSLRRTEPERLNLLANLSGLHVRGVPVDWEAVHGPAEAVARLPRYPWQHERYWSETESLRRGRLRPREHPLLEARLGTAHRVWHTSIDPAAPAWLGDHRVEDAVVFPAAAVLEMALAAGRASAGEDEDGLMVEGLDLRRALVLPEGGAVEVELAFDGPGPAFSVSSRPLGREGGWTRHATGEVRLAPGRQDRPPVEWDRLLERCTTRLAPWECYRTLDSVGLPFGPSFQTLREVHLGEGEAAAEILFAPPPEEAERSLLFPPVLDGALQLACLASLAMLDGEGFPDRAYMPVGFDRVVLHRRPRSRVRAHARCDRSESGGFRHDLVLFDEEGRVIAEVEGVRSRALGRAATDADSPDPGLLLRYRWVEDMGEASGEPDAAASEPTVAAEAPGGPWLVLSDGSRFVERVVAGLAARGAPPTVVERGPAFQRTAPARFHIDPREPGDADRLLEALDREGAGLGGVLHLWNLPAAASGDIGVDRLVEEADAGSVSLLHLVQALERARVRPERGILLVTRAAQSVNGAGVPAVGASPAWGLGRVLANELPQLGVRLVDLGEDEATGVDEILRELGARDGEDEVAFREGRRWVHRLEHPDPAELTVRRSLSGEFGAGTPERMARLEIGTPGVLETLSFRAATRPRPGPGQVLIGVEAAGLNFKDVAKAMGLLSDETLEGTASGRELGLECVGTVEALGEGVTGLGVGDRVVGFASHALSTHALAQADLVAPLPEGVSAEAAATLVTVGMTAHYALNHVARIQPGERVLIHSASGGVGLAAIQICRQAGAEVLATAGSEAKRTYLRELGIRHVMDSRSLAFADEVMDITGGRGVDVVLNSLTGEALARGVGVLAPFGRFVELGKRDIQENQRLSLRAFQRNLTFAAVDLDRLSVERPQRAGALISELLSMVREGSFEPLPHEVFPAGRAVEAFRYMAQARHIGKIVVDMRELGESDVADSGPLALRPDATYLVTGGLSGFGLATARWLVEKGARHLALLGRSGAGTSEARAAVDELRSEGVDVFVAAADVTVESRLREVLDHVDESMPPLRGVVHCAMVLDDGAVHQLDRARFHRVLGPKVLGGWLLHRLTLGRTLDFFLSYSSISSLIGNPGQANYAAANAFLDALADHRRGLGLPALTVNWGAMSRVGVVARSDDLDARFDRLGIDLLDPDEGFVALESLLRSDVSCVAVTPPFRWDRMAHHLPAGSAPRLRELAEGDGAKGDASECRSSGVRARILSADPADRVPRLLLHLRQVLGLVLGASPDAVEGDVPLVDMGLDSLMAVELVSRIRADLNVEVPPMRFVEGITLEGLAERLAGELGVSPDADA